MDPSRAGSRWFPASRDLLAAGNRPTRGAAGQNRAGTPPHHDAAGQARAQTPPARGAAGQARAGTLPHHDAADRARAGHGERPGAPDPRRHQQPRLLRIRQNPLPWAPRAAPNRATGPDHAQPAVRTRGDLSRPLPGQAAAVAAGRCGRETADPEERPALEVRAESHTAPTDGQPIAGPAVPAPTDDQDAGWLVAPSRASPATLASRIRPGPPSSLARWPRDCNHSTRGNVRPRRARILFSSPAHPLTPVTGCQTSGA
jgi:hypothetical protein